MAFEHSVVWTFPHSGVFFYNKREIWIFTLPKSIFISLCFYDFWTLSLSQKASSYHYAFMTFEHSVVRTFLIPGLPSTSLVSYEFLLPHKLSSYLYLFMTFEHSVVWTFPHSEVFLYNNREFWIFTLPKIIFISLCFMS